MIFIDHSTGMKAPDEKPREIDPGSLLNADGSLVVKIYRKPFDTFFKLVLPNGHTEELEAEEAIEWFNAHGSADLTKLERAMDYVQNFGKGQLRIPNPVDPEKLLGPTDPKV